MRALLPVLLVVGAGLMLAFEDTLPRLLALACLFGFIALGVWAIASPAYLAEEDDGG